MLNSQDVNILVEIGSYLNGKDFAFLLSTCQELWKHKNIIPQKKVYSYKLETHLIKNLYPTQKKYVDAKGKLDWQLYCPNEIDRTLTSICEFNSINDALINLCKGVVSIYNEYVTTSSVNRFGDILYSIEYEYETDIILTIGSHELKHFSKKVILNIPHVAIRFSIIQIHPPGYTAKWYMLDNYSREKIRSIHESEINILGSDFIIYEGMIFHIILQNIKFIID
jgi:hypothetical protein